MLATLGNFWSKPSPGPLTPSANAEAWEVVRSKRMQGCPLSQGTLASPLNTPWNCLSELSLHPIPLSCLRNSLLPREGAPGPLLQEALFNLSPSSGQSSARAVSGCLAVDVPV